MAAGLSGCGGGGSSTPGGGGPSPTPQSLAITPGTSMLRVDQTEVFTGTLTLSNGQSQQAQPTWQSDNITVLTFEGGNVARGRSNGTATIIASSQGVTATRLVRVFNNFHGTWEGDYVLRRCEETGDFRGLDFCDREDGFYVGEILPVAMILRQQADAITGDFHLGGLEGTTSGAVGSNGRYTGVANITVTDDSATVAFAVQPLDLNVEGDRLTGTFTVTVTIPGLSGHGRFDAQLQTVVRIDDGAQPLRVGTRPVGGFKAALDALRR